MLWLLVLVLAVVWLHTCWPTKAWKSVCLRQVLTMILQKILPSSKTLGILLVVVPAPSSGPSEISMPAIGVGKLKGSLIPKLQEPSGIGGDQEWLVVEQITGAGFPSVLAPRISNAKALMASETIGQLDTKMSSPITTGLTRWLVYLEPMKGCQTTRTDFSFLLPNPGCTRFSSRMQQVK